MQISSSTDCDLDIVKLSVPGIQLKLDPVGTAAPLGNGDESLDKNHICTIKTIYSTSIADNLRRETGASACVAILDELRMRRQRQLIPTLRTSVSERSWSIAPEMSLFEETECGQR